MNRHLVHFVQRQIHQVSDKTTDADRTHQTAHQTADGAEFAERNQRAVIVIDEGHGGAFAQAIDQRFRQGLGLLVRRLRAGGTLPA